MSPLLMALVKPVLPSSACSSSWLCGSGRLQASIGGLAFPSAALGCWKGPRLGEQPPLLVCFPTEEKCTARAWGVDNSAPQVQLYCFVLCAFCSPLFKLACLPAFSFLLSFPWDCWLYTVCHICLRVSWTDPLVCFACSSFSFDCFSALNLPELHADLRPSDLLEPLRPQCEVQQGLGKPLLVPPLCKPCREHGPVSSDTAIHVSHCPAIPTPLCCLPVPDTHGLLS